MRIKAKFLYLYSRCDRFGQAAPRQPANLFAIAPCLHYVLDRRRSGKMQVNLLLPSVCTIFAFAIAKMIIRIVSVNYLTSHEYFNDKYLYKNICAFC